MKYGLLACSKGWGSNAQFEIVVVVDDQLIVLPWYSITEWCARIRSTRLHPEAHSKLSQTAHTPDVGVISHSLMEMKSIAC